nr:MAG: nonstructural protein [Microvirus sp.]
MQVFSVRDKAVGAFLQPFYARSRGEAMRSFIDAMADGNHAFEKHPEDYDLYYLGDFDEEKGVFNDPEGVKVVSSPMNIMSGLSAAEIVKNQM